MQTWSARLCTPDIDGLVGGAPVVRGELGVNAAHQLLWRRSPRYTLSGPRSTMVPAAAHAIVSTDSAHDANVERTRLCTPDLDALVGGAPVVDGELGVNATHQLLWRRSPRYTLSEARPTMVRAAG